MIVAIGLGLGCCTVFRVIFCRWTRGFHVHTTNHMTVYLPRSLTSDDSSSIGFCNAKAALLRAPRTMHSFEYKAEIERHRRVCGALVPGSFSDTGTNMIFSAQEFLTTLTRHVRLGVSLNLQLKSQAAIPIAMGELHGSKIRATVPAPYDIVYQRFLPVMDTRSRVVIDPP